MTATSSRTAPFTSLLVALVVGLVLTTAAPAVAAPDGDAPVLVSLALSATTIDTGSCLAPEVTATAHITDVGTGLAWGYLQAYTASGAGHLRHWHRISGTANDGIYQMTFVWSDDSPTGNYNLAAVLQDEVQNSRVYTGSDLSAIGAPTHVAVTYNEQAFPCAPGQVIGEPQDKAATVAWTPSSYGPAASEFIVTANPGGEAVTVPASVTSATLGGLTNGTDYTFTVTAANSAGAGAPSEPSTVVTPRDILAPTLTITKAPSVVTQSTSAEFAFSASEPVTMSCSLDGAAFSACGSPASYTALDDGSHNFSIRATDDADNTTAQTHSWRVDTAAPQTGLTTGPRGWVDDTSASFGFTASERNSTFRCRLDAEAWQPCISPRVYVGLTQGGHTFRVMATDAAGNRDSTPVVREWTVDTVRPTTKITSAPRRTTHSRTAQFGFTSSDKGSTFKCRLDGQLWRRCSDPRLYENLRRGLHTFRVRAADRAGNVDLTPATREWVIK